MTQDINEVRDIQSEAALVATLINNPGFAFFSEQLKPQHFTDQMNSYLYYALTELAKRGVNNADVVTIQSVWNATESWKNKTSRITVEQLNEHLNLSKIAARATKEEYELLTSVVMDKALRRNLHTKLQEGQHLCFADSVEKIDQQIYKLLDDAVLEFASTNYIPQFKEVVDGLWQEIKTSPLDGHSGTPFFIPELNEFATIDAGELFLFGGKEKSGKSMMLLQIAMDMVRQHKKVLYIDSELNSKMFTARLLAHLTKTEFMVLKSGRYGKEVIDKVEKAIEWIKGKDFTHIYLPMFESQSLYTTVKKVFHTQGIDVLIVDYFKAGGSTEAYENYAELGKITDMVKNAICGSMNIAGIGAVQLTHQGKIADSAKIGRNVSTVAFLQAKTPEEILADGIDCGNTKLRVGINRNGRQQGDSEYIDLNFTGNLIRYDPARQHANSSPY